MSVSPRLQYDSEIVLNSVTHPVDATVQIPGSKSITNRALLLAALAQGDSILHGPLFSDDTDHMIAALIELGAKIERTEQGDLQITGTSGKLTPPSAPLFIGNSGTSVRFLSAACVHLPAGSSATLDGIERMRQRPIQDLIDALSPLGGRIESIMGTGCPPVKVCGGGLAGGTTTVNGAISSQYLSGLLMSAPLAWHDVTIKVAGNLVSKPYVAMTREVMHSFGVEVSNGSGDDVFVPAPQQYRGCDYSIEPDASNASYFLAAAAVTGGSVTVSGLSSSSIQGDTKFAHILEQTGCRVKYASDSITVAGPDRLSPIDIDLSAMPDMAQTLAVICFFANGRSKIRGLSTLKVKETDRIAAIANELRKLGTAVEAGSDYWIIDPPIGLPTPAKIATYDDHRMAMSFAVAGLRIDGLTIDDPGCVAKTFPDFWKRWNEAFYDKKLADGE